MKFSEAVVISSVVNVEQFGNSMIAFMISIDFLKGFLCRTLYIVFIDNVDFGTHL